MAFLKVKELATYVVEIPDEIYKKYISGEYDDYDVYNELDGEIFDNYLDGEVTDIEITEN